MFSVELCYCDWKILYVYSGTESNNGRPSTSNTPARFLSCFYQVVSRPNPSLYLFKHLSLLSLWSTHILGYPAFAAAFASFLP